MSVSGAIKLHEVLSLYFTGTYPVLVKNKIVIYLPVFLLRRE